MEDSEVVAAIVAGDPAGLGAAYDKYAIPLYTYCRAMLREPADAADAVQDTFLVAASKLAGLRDPGKLRPWLYAVARNECLRRLRAGNVTLGLDEAAQLPVDQVDVVSTAEQSDLRELVRDAIDGLNPGERDVIELSLGHAFEGDDLAAALGVSRNHAHALLSRARSQFERSLGALMVARTGRQACPALQVMLDGWDGRMTVLMRKRISRHIDHCGVCDERKRRELTPALLAVGVPLATLLPWFREQVLRHCADPTRAAPSHQFGPTGFPKALAPHGAHGAHGALSWRHAAHYSHGVAVAATSVAAAGVIAVVVIGTAPHGDAPSAVGHGSDGATQPGASVSYTGQVTSSGGGHGLAPSASGVAPGPRPSVTLIASDSPSPVATVMPGVTDTPATSPAVSVSSQVNSTGASSPATSPAASSSSPSNGGGQGTLAISPSAVTLASGGGGASGSFTITASGGPISHFNITVRSAHELSVSPSSGSLAAGQSATITVSTTSTGPINTWIVINPGGNKLTVTLN